MAWRLGFISFIQGFTRHLRQRLSHYRRKGHRRPSHGRPCCAEAGAEEPRLSHSPAAGSGEVALASGSVSNGRLSSAACELACCRQPSQQLRPFLPFNTLPIASATLGTLLCFIVCVCAYTAPGFGVCVYGEPQKVISGLMQRGSSLVGASFIRVQNQGGFKQEILPLDSYRYSRSFQAHGLFLWVPAKFALKK